MRGAPPGDLYIFVGIAQHSIFQRDGANIFCRVPIPFTTAALGGDDRGADRRGQPRPVTVPRRHAIGRTSSVCAARA